MMSSRSVPSATTPIMRRRFGRLTASGAPLKAPPTPIASEDERWPIREAAPVEVLRYLIEDGGHSQAELAEIIGSRPRASEILSRKRALTIEMIDKICKAWRLPHSLLAVPYKLADAAPAKKAARKKNRPRKGISAEPRRRAKRAA